MFVSYWRHTSVTQALSTFPRQMAQLGSGLSLPDGRVGEDAELGGMIGGVRGHDHVGDVGAEVAMVGRIPVC